MSLVDVSQIRTWHEKFWDWIFATKDGNSHPLKVSNGGDAQKQVGNALILAGSLQGAGQKDRSLRIPAGVEFIFVPVDNVLCTKDDGTTTSDEDLIKEVNNDISGAKGKYKITIDGVSQQVDQLQPHLFDLHIKEKVHGTGRSGNGEPTGPTRAAAAAYYAIIPVNSLHSGSRIQISARDIDIIYTVA